MYFRGGCIRGHVVIILSANSYWSLRAFWAGVKGKGDAFTPPKRCPSTDLWHDMWQFGATSDELEF